MILGLALSVAVAEEVAVVSSGASVSERGVVWEQDAWAVSEVPLSGVVTLVPEVWVGFDAWSEPEVGLLSTGVAPGLRVGHGRWWALAQPGVMVLGQPVGLSGRSVQGFGMLLAGVETPSEVTWMAGAMGATALDGTWAVPLLGVDLALGSQAQLTVLLPAEVSLRVGDRWVGGVDVTLEGWSYTRADPAGPFLDYGPDLPGYLRTVAVGRLAVSDRVAVGAHGGADWLRHAREPMARRPGALGPMPCVGLDLVLRAGRPPPAPPRA